MLDRARLRGAIVGLLFVAFAAQLLHVARLYSATWDEAHHLYDGYTIWTRHDYRLNPEVPPLVKLTAALPLLPMHLVAPPNQGRSEPKEAFLDGRAFLVANGMERVLFPARMAVMLFTLALAAVVYAAGREMFGQAAALIALLLLVLDPNILANGALVTTDVASACCIFSTVYAFYRYVRVPSLARMFLTGLLAGLTLAAKFTGILVAPMLLLLAFQEGFRARSIGLLGRRLAAWAAVLLCSWAMLWAFYGFRDAPAPGGLALSPALGDYIQSMPNPEDAAALGALARLHLLPQAYLWGLANTKKTEWEYVCYFFGRIYRHGPWQYFPAAFLIKSTLPLLLLLAAAPLARRRGQGRGLCFLLIPVVVYFAVVTASHFDIGARHLLPIYPFLYVLAGSAGAALWRRGPRLRVAVVLLLGWQAVTSVRVAPAYMAYGNEAWGGPSEVHKYLSDANVDWGQQLKEVKAYLARNHITECWFAYFPDGAVEPQDYGVRCHRLPTESSLFWLNLPMEVPPVIDGTVLISDSDLEGVEFGDQSLNPYDDFRSRRPVAVLQYGVDVYQGRFAVPLASALVDVRISGELSRAGRPQQALEVAGKALALAPGSAIVQQNIADLLAAAHRPAEALGHYREAERLAVSVRPELQQDLLPAIAAGVRETGGASASP